jgi:glycosyltransferase involved in cell wall biosynthesis
MTPYFSVIIPMYNRAFCIQRALDSCLAQEFTDFEVVVVDDGSADDSCARVGEYSDPRVRLVRHPANRGRCPARNTGMAAARGQWFVFLDSDYELLPGALQAMHERASALPADVGGMRFMCRDDRGQLAPDPPHRDEIWDYEGYIRWFEAMRGRPSESLPCARADTFPAVSFPDDHSEEMMYHLDLAQRWRILAASSVVRVYHYDAADRITVPRAGRALRYSPDASRNLNEVLERHGAALRQWAPRSMEDIYARGVLWSLLAGDRRGGVSYMRRSGRSARTRPSLVAILLAGLVSRHALAWMQQLSSTVRVRFGQ